MNNLFNNHDGSLTPEEFRRLGLEYKEVRAQRALLTAKDAELSKIQNNLTTKLLDYMKVMGQSSLSIDGVGTISPKGSVLWTIDSKEQFSKMVLIYAANILCGKYNEGEFAHEATIVDALNLLQFTPHQANISTLLERGIPEFTMETLGLKTIEKEGVSFKKK